MDSIHIISECGLSCGSQTRTLTWNLHRGQWAYDALDIELSGYVFGGKGRI